MKVYIASRYIKHKAINREVFNMLRAAGIDVFLPESINTDAITKEEMFIVSEICYKEIDICDVILIVSPFGRSVSSEVGYAINEKRRNRNKKLILLNPNGIDDVMDKEAMISPYIDIVVENCVQLIDCLLNYNTV